ncbi:MAG: hypoxanthine phosphoribosyltransferase [Thermoleophilia bacterium]|nr:hypoxanthine phosphoribosyltransferase [Thermoleophilia bacterium]
MTVTLRARSQGASSDAARHPLAHRVKLGVASTTTSRFQTTFVVYRDRHLAATEATNGDLPMTKLLDRRPPESEAAFDDGATCRLWRNFRGTIEPRFVTESERECAELLDFYGIAWEYEPVMFVLETDDQGRVSEAFRPDFYLPELNLFLEVTTMKQELVTRKNRKVRKLRQRYPDVNVRLFYRRDIEALGQKLRSRAAS